MFKWNDKNLTCPQLFGYNSIPSWPLNEEYSKWKLTFFKPWIKTKDKLKADDGFKSELEEFMWNRDHFPWSTRLEMLWANRNKHSVDVSAAGALVGNNEYTPTEEERDHASANEDAIEEADNAVAPREENYEDIEDELFKKWIIGFQMDTIGQQILMSDW